MTEGIIDWLDSCALRPPYCNPAHLYTAMIFLITHTHIHTYTHTRCVCARCPGLTLPVASLVPSSQVSRLHQSSRSSNGWASVNTVHPCCSTPGNCSQCTMYFVLYTLFCTVESVLYTLYCTHCTVHTILFTPNCTPFTALDSVQRTQ